MAKISIIIYKNSYSKLKDLDNWLFFRKIADNSLILTFDYLYHSFSYDKEKIQHSQLIINDIQGKILLQNDLENDEIDTHGFPKGVYFLQILKENKVVFREKVVILER